MGLTSTFSAMPNVQQFTDLPDAWHWSMAPGFDFTAILSRDREYVLQSYALRSYEEDLARTILSFAREHDSALIAPPERPLVLVEGFAHPGTAFDTMVAVGPTVHKYHDENAQLHERTRAIFPAYRCEFAGDENEQDARYRYTRAAGVPVTTLNRQPRPYLKMRHQAETGRVIPKCGFIGLPSLVHELRTLENSSDRFVEFENYRHEVWRVEWDGTWILTGESEQPRQLEIEELLEFAKSNLYGPNLDAGDSEFNK